MLSLNCFQLSMCQKRLTNYQFRFHFWCVWNFSKWLYILCSIIWNWKGQGKICNHRNIYPQSNGSPRSMSIFLLVPVDCFKVLPAFTEQINCRHTPQMVWSPATALHISLFYWMWLTPPDIYIFLQPCTVVANKAKKEKEEKIIQRGRKKGRKESSAGG